MIPRSIWVRLMSALKVALLGFIFLPSMLAAETATVWQTMTPGAHEPGIPAAVAQCNTLAGFTAGDCAAFGAMLEAGTCQVIQLVPNGTSYEQLTGPNGVQGMTLVALPTARPAYRCALPSGGVLDWYSAELFDAACNNVGANPRPPQTIVPPDRVTRTVNPGAQLFVPGLEVCNCVQIGDIWINLPSDRNTQYHWDFTENH